MESVHLPAHFDGVNIVLDEPYKLEPNTKLMITVINEQSSSDAQGWSLLSMRGLEKAYGEEEPEYSLDSITEANPSYERR